MTAVISINIGGTTTRVAAMTDARILRTASFETKSEGYFATLERIIREARKLIEACTHPTIAAGVCVAGNVENGTITGAGNLKAGWIGAKIGADLSEKLDLPVAVLNDGAAEGLGEFAAYRHPLTYVGWGTGIGVSEVTLVNSRPVSKATERGHDIITFGNEPCGCGGRGHAEARLGGINIAKQFGVDNAGELSDKAWDTQVLPVMAAFLRNLSTRSSDPVVLGGGVAMKQLSPEGKGRLPLLQELVDGLVATTKPPVLKLARHGEDSGLVGAAYAAYAVA